MRHEAHYEGVLGTSLELQFVGVRAEAGAAAERAALAEIDRLETIFSAYRLDSELSRWQRADGAEAAVSPELAEVLAASEEWRVRTGGAFNPAVEAATRLWRDAAAAGAPADEAELERIAAALAGPLWAVDRERGTARRLTRLPATLNAIAKGYIIDAACARAAASPGVLEALVNVGGDLRHRGERPLRVAIADPFADAENADPIAEVAIRDEALATSGSYRRGFRVGERWRSHLIDPRTGRPCDRTVSASVVAPNALLADVLATACSVLDPPASLALCDSVPGAGCLLVTDEGTRAVNSIWRDHAT